MKKTYLKNLILTFSLILAVLLIINSYLFYTRIDFSRDKAFSLSNFTSELLKSVNDKVQITYYVSDKLKTLYPQVKDVSDFLYAYAKECKNVSINVLDPQKESLEEILQNYGVLPQQIQTSSNTETSFATVYSAITIEYKDKIEIIPFVLSTESLEYDLDSRLQYLVNDKTRSVLILVGNNLSLDTEYSYLVPWLESAGFVCQQVNASDLVFFDASTPLIVLGSNNLTQEDVYNIEDFIMKGSNAAFFTSKNSTNAFTDWQCTKDKNTYLPDLLDFWGIQIRDELVLDLQNYRLTMQTQTSPASVQNQYINYPFWLVMQYSSLAQNSELANAFSGLETYWVSPLELYETEETKITPFLKSSKASYLMAEPFDTDPFTNKTNDNSNLTGEYTIAATLEGKLNGYYTTGKSNDVRLFVLADQFVASNMIEYTNSPHNMNFVTNVALWLCGEDEMLNIHSKGFRTTTLNKISDSDQFNSEMHKTIFLCIIFPVLLVLLICTILIFMRKKGAKIEE